MSPDNKMKAVNPPKPKRKYRVYTAELECTPETGEFFLKFS